MLTLPLADRDDVVRARRRARELAGLVELDAEPQARLGAAVAELASAAVEHGREATVELALSFEDRRRAVLVTVQGIEHAAFGEDGIDLRALRGLVDRAEARDTGASGVVRLTQELAPSAWVPPAEDVARALDCSEAGRDQEAAGERELRRQNADLARALTVLRDRQEELLRLNRQLTDTNRAVTALHRELDEQAAQLREADLVKSRFLSAVSHELRTPLYAVQGMAEALTLPGADPLTDQQRADVALVQQAVQEALGLVNDQLDLAKIEAGRTTVRVGPVHVGELLSALRGMLGHLRSSDRVDLVVEDPGADVPVLRTDGGKLSQVLRNYVSNALKFTEEGTVRVWAEPTADGQAVRFSVADTGIGLTPEDATRAFDEFVQVGDGERRAVAAGMRGTGLGLPLARRLTELLGGTASVTSERGVGSTFTAEVPVRFVGDDPSLDVVDLTAPDGQPA